MILTTSIKSSDVKVYFLFKENKTKPFLNKLKLSLPIKVLKDFEKENDNIINYYNNNTYHYLVGLGKEEEMNIDKLNHIFSDLKKMLGSLKDKSIMFFINETKSIEFSKDLILSISNIYFKFDHKSKKSEPNKNINLHISKQNFNELSNILKLANSIELVKKLGDEPANILNPTEYVKRIKLRGKKSGFKVKVFDEKKLRKMGMNTLLSVSDGSKYPGYLVELTLPKSIKSKKVIKMKKGGGKKSVKNNKSKKVNKDKYVLVGKGITFDSGGISLKGSNNMGEMKTDMLGSATVLGIMDYLAQIKSNKNVVGLLAIAENMPSKDATRPGDVVTSYSGKTVEILNTDAEGRLVLSDSLTYAQEIGGNKIIDLATLTGQQESVSCSLFGSIMSNNKEFSNELIEVGDTVNERLSELPLYQEFKDQTKSDIADVKNDEFGCRASTIHGGAFLWNFIEDKTEWCHLDIAGPSRAKDTTTGYGVRLITSYLEKN